jgi:hypothetical protein
VENFLSCSSLIVNSEMQAGISSGSVWDVIWGSRHLCNEFKAHEENNFPGKQTAWNQWPEENSTRTSAKTETSEAGVQTVLRCEW